jgi:peptidoglycan hydrolase CwlO-like protein
MNTKRKISFRSSPLVKIIFLFVLCMFFTSFLYAQESKLKYKSVEEALIAYENEIDSLKEKISKRLEYLDNEAKEEGQDLIDSMDSYINDSFIPPDGNEQPGIKKYLSDTEPESLNNPPNRGYYLEYRDILMNKGTEFLVNNMKKDESLVALDSMTQDDEQSKSSNESGRTACWVSILIILELLAIMGLGYLFWKSSTSLQDLEKDIWSLSEKVIYFESNVEPAVRKLNENLSHTNNQQTELGEKYESLAEMYAKVVDAIKKLGGQKAGPEARAQDRGMMGQQEREKVAPVPETIVDQYNRAQTSRSDRQSFANRMTPCRMENVQSILIQKSGEPPIFNTDSNGFFMISNDNTPEPDMFVIFGFPVEDLSKVAILEQAFTVNRIPGLEFAIKMNTPAKVRKIGNQWTLTTKGQIDIRA